METSRFIALSPMRQCHNPCDPADFFPHWRCSSIAVPHFSRLLREVGAPPAVPMATEDRIEASPAGGPPKAQPRRDEFVGPDACADCHASKVRTQKLTPMAHAALRPVDSEALRSHDQLTFQPSALHLPDLCASQTAVSIPSPTASRQFQRLSVGHSGWANPARLTSSNATAPSSKVG